MITKAREAAEDDAGWVTVAANTKQISAVHPEKSEYSKRENKPYKNSNPPLNFSSFMLLAQETKAKGEITQRSKPKTSIMSKSTQRSATRTIKRLADTKREKDTNTSPTKMTKLKTTRPINEEREAINEEVISREKEIITKATSPEKAVTLSTTPKRTIPREKRQSLNKKISLKRNQNNRKLKSLRLMKLLKPKSQSRRLKNRDLRSRHSKRLLRILMKEFIKNPALQKKAKMKLSSML